MARDIHNIDNNFYLILGLDFRKPETDNIVIQNKIAQKQIEWSGKSNNVQKANQVKKYLDFVNDKSIAKVMLPDADDEQGQENRFNEANAAITIVDNLVKEKLNAVVSSSKIKKSVLENMVSKYPEYYLTYAMLEQLLVKLNVSIVDDTKITKNKKTNTSKIGKDLKTLNLDNLYAYILLYLGENKNTKYKGNYTEDSLKALPNTELVNIAKEAYSYYNKFPNKDTVLTAKVTLSSQITTNFKTEDKKKEYDASLAPDTESLPEGVIKVLQEHKDLNAKVVYNKSLDLIKMCTKFNSDWEESDIIELLQQEALKMHITIELPQADSGKTLFVKCLCGELSPSNLTHCPKCGAAFIIKCPECGATLSQGVNNCTKCGFEIKKRLMAEQECKNAQNFIDKNMFDDAQRAIDKAKRLWSKCTDITRLETLLKSSRKNIEESINKINKYIEQKYYYTAQSEYDNLKRRCSTFQDNVLYSKITAKIAAAQKWYSMAMSKQASGNESEIIEYCTKALDECADMNEAKTLMLRYPPKAATNMQVSVGENRNTIRWNRSVSTGSVIYKLIRKYNSMPSSDKDGEVLVETSSVYFEDNTVKPGVAVYYAVYTYRGGISAPALYCGGPVFNYTDVHNVQTIESDGKVVLSWDTDPAINFIEIVRKEGMAATSRNDGVKIPISSNTGCTDLNLVNDRVYFYTIYAGYRNEKGIHYSSGKVVRAVPTAPPNAISECWVNKNNSTFEIQWRNSGKGNVELYYSDKPNICSFGDIKTKVEINRLLKPLQVSNLYADRASFQMTTEGVRYVYPINVSNNTCVVGKELTVSSLADFKLIRTSVMSGKQLVIQLDIQASKNADKIVVLYRTDKYPDNPNDNAAQKMIITRQQYEADKSITIYDIDNVNYYFTIYAALGNNIFSSGINTMFANASKGEVYYDVQIRKAFMKGVQGYKINITSNGIQSIPKMVIVKKVRVLPFDRNDGIQVQSIGPFNGGKNEVLIDDKNFNDNFKVALFFEDDNNYNFIKLQRRM